MRHYSALLFIFAAGVTLMLVACKEKKKPEETIITTHYVPHRAQAPIAMPTDSQTVSVTWLGRSYRVNTVRVPLDSVTVTGDGGQKYIDNRVRIVIARQDGSVFFENTFFKKSFTSYVQEPFTTGGILAGIRLDKADGNALKFSVAVAMPEATDDLYVPLEMSIDNLGGISIHRDDDMGMKDDNDSDFDFDDAEYSE